MPADTEIESPESGEPETGLLVRCAVETHTGLVREANEDDYAVVPEAGVYLVADGMGGHVAGKVASGICVETVASYFVDGSDDERLVGDAVEGLSDAAVELAEALLLANRRIHGQSVADRQLSGMGTTAVAVRVLDGRLAVAHAGDSRCYLLRDSVLQQVTVDHSLSNFLLALGRELEARYAEQTMSNVIMRALGLEADVAIDTKEFPVRHGDRVMLCSDGLSDLVSAGEIEAILNNVSSPREDAVQRLVQLALDAGGRDNITVMLVDIVAAGAGDDAEGGFDETLEIPSPSDGFDIAETGDRVVTLAESASDDD